MRAQVSYGLENQNTNLMNFRKEHIPHVLSTTEGKLCRFTSMQHSMVSSCYCSNTIVLFEGYLSLRQNSSRTEFVVHCGFRQASNK